MKLVTKGELSNMQAEFSQQEQAMVNSEERIADVKRWREMMASTLTIDVSGVGVVPIVAMLM